MTNTTDLAAIMERRRTECAYATPCKQCIHAACGSYRDQKRIEELERKEMAHKPLIRKVKYTCSW